MNAKSKMRAWTGMAMVLIVLSAMCLVAAAQETADEWVKKGDDVLLYKKNAGLEAIDAYEKALQLDPQNESILLREATIFDALGMHAATKALSIIEKKLERNPQDAEAWQLRSGALSELGMMQEANQSIEKALKIYDQEIQKDPLNGTAWYYKAWILNNIGRHDESLLAYEKLIELDYPQKVDAWNGKGTALYLLERFDEAIAAYDMAIELDPENIEAWFSKGSVLDSMGRNAESQAAFAKADELRELKYKD